MPDIFVFQNFLLFTVFHCLYGFTKADIFIFIFRFLTNILSPLTYRLHSIFFNFQFFFSFFFCFFLFFFSYFVFNSSSFLFFNFTASYFLSDYLFFIPCSPQLPLFFHSKLSVRVFSLHSLQIVTHQFSRFWLPLFSGYILLFIVEKISSKHQIVNGLDHSLVMHVSPTFLPCSIGEK